MHLVRRTTSRVCGSSALTKIIDLGEQYLQGSFVKPGKELPPTRRSWHFKEEFVRRQSETPARGIGPDIPLTEHRDCAQEHREALRKYSFW